MSELRSFVAPLFLPAHRAGRYAKAAASGADAVILDLEDGVPAVEKRAARDALCDDFTDLPLIVRINAMGTEWHAEDLARIEMLKLDAVMVPKAECATDLAPFAAAYPTIALIETAAGLDQARTIARLPGVLRLAFGSVDYAADLGCEHFPAALLAARAEVVLASRLGNLQSPLDGVTTSFADPAAVEVAARDARAMGFGGKLLIHPAQVASVLAGFKPTADELEWAQRVLASAAGAAAVDGAMVDEPVRVRARSLINRAKPAAT